MQFSWVRHLPHATAVVVMRRCRVMVFEKPEVIDKTGWGAHRHTTSRDTGMIDTANVACTSDIWRACSTAAPFEATSLWQIIILHCEIINALNCKLCSYWRIARQRPVKDLPAMKNLAFSVWLGWYSKLDVKGVKGTQNIPEGFGPSLFITN